MWKHIFALIAAPLTVTLGMWGSNTMAGTHIPFTAGTILIPAIPVLINSLLHLYQTPPTNPLQ
jgi:hypothetical protein